MSELASFGFVEGMERVERAPSQGAVHAWRVGDIKNRVPFRAALNALEDRWQETRAPKAWPTAGLDAARDEHHEPWQVFVL